MGIKLARFHVGQSFRWLYFFLQFWRQVESPSSGQFTGEIPYISSSRSIPLLETFHTAHKTEEDSCLHRSLKDDAFPWRCEFPNLELFWSGFPPAFAKSSKVAWAFLSLRPKARRWDPRASVEIEIQPDVKFHRGFPAIIFDLVIPTVVNEKYLKWVKSSPL